MPAEKPSSTDQEPRTEGTPEVSGSAAIRLLREYPPCAALSEAHHSGSRSTADWLSVVIPVLNESATIESTLAAVAAAVGPRETIVVDGGSTDDTAARAAAAGAHVITAPRGRGSQQHAGALVASGNVLWFLHADTLPPPAAAEPIRQALADPKTIAGNFDIRFDGDFAAARFLTRLYRYLSWIGLRYGDSGYFVRAADYAAVGGFGPYPIFEDLDLMRRLKRRGRFVRVAATVVTSSRRFQGRPFVGVFARWAFLQGLYWLGVSPVRLGRLYHHVRVPGRGWFRRAATVAGADHGQA